MAASPPFKIYRSGEYIGCVKHSEDAAVLVSTSGGEVRFGHKRVIWREGDEEISASESYDDAAEIMRSRL